MLIPDSIVASFAFLSAEQIREIVNAVRAFQEGRPVAMDSLDSQLQFVWNTALPEMEEARRKRQDISEKRKAAASQSHKNRKSEPKESEQMLANASKCYQLQANASKCKQMLANADENIDLNNKDINNNSLVSLTESPSGVNEDTSPIESPNTSLSKSLKKVSSPKSKDIEEQFIANIKEIELIPPFREWLAYKREKKQTYTKSGLTKCFKSMLSYSGGDPVMAQQMVDFSIANNYTGLYAPRETATKAKPRRQEATPQELNDPWNIFINPYEESEQ